MGRAGQRGSAAHLAAGRGVEKVATVTPLRNERGGPPSITVVDDRLTEADEEIHHYHSREPVPERHGKGGRKMRL